MAYENYLDQATIDTALTLEATVAGVHVNTAAGFEVAAGMLRSVEKQRKELEDKRLAHTRPLDEEKKGIMARFALATDPLERIAKHIRVLLNRYTQEQERLRREAQKKLDDEAAAERRKIEEKRLDEERKARAKEEELRQRAAAAESEKEREALEKRIAAAREKAAQKDEALESKLDQVQAPVVEANVPQVAGLSGRRKWLWRTTNAALIPDKYWVLNEKLINAEVRALGNQTNIPGIEAFPEDGFAVRK